MKMRPIPDPRDLAATLSVVTDDLLDAGLENEKLREGLKVALRVIDQKRAYIRHLEREIELLESGDYLRFSRMVEGEE